MDKIVKAIVAVIGGGLIIAKEVWGVDVGIEEGTISQLVTSALAIATAIAVYRLPNAP